MIYNFNISYEEMLKKLKHCKKWGVQITDCRYRPLGLASDRYNPHLFRAGQMKDEYYIHTSSGWTDKKIRTFRNKIREHNIWVRYAKDKGLKYDKRMEKWSAIHNTFKFFDLDRPPRIEKIENSKMLQKRVRLMNKVKNICKKHELKVPNLGNPSIKKIDKKLNNFIEKHKINL